MQSVFLSDTIGGKRGCGNEEHAMDQMTAIIHAPAAGYRNGGSSNNVGSNGNYWSSSLNTSNSNNAYNLNFNSSNVDWNNNNRRNGQSVRAVSEFTRARTFLPFELSKYQLAVDLYRAYKDARRHKRYKLYQLKYELNYERKIISLRDSLYKFGYNPGSSECFIIHEPKMREVFAAPFQDRIVHHLLYNYVYRYFVKHFVTDSYSCIKGRGTHYGIERLDEFIKNQSNNYSKACFVLKLDISGYFMRINRQKLLGLCQELCFQIQEPYGALVNFLVEKIVLNNPVKKCIRVGALSEWRKLPKNKSLFYSPLGCGLPIGNLTSQLFSNVYLDKLDKYCIQVLGCSYYGRYVDDFFIVAATKSKLRSLIKPISDFLEKELELELNNDKIQIYSIYRGVPFLGAFIKPYRIYIENGSLKRMKQKLAALNMSAPDSIWRSLNSFLGILSHTRSFNLRKEWLVPLVPSAYWSGYFGKAFLTYKLW